MPDCGREVIDAEEEAYFFKLSAFQDRLIRLYEENPHFMEPQSRLNEMVNNFIKPGLEDLCVSRTSFSWGIPVTFDPGHVVYVWVDALTNYITALGYGNDKYHEFEKFGRRRAFRRQEICASTRSSGRHARARPAAAQKVFGHGWRCSRAER
ncbi:MAG: class I tRNA ligase family protein [Anaerotruncus massiliensis (ex Togo et al. 2019)]